MKQLSNFWLVMVTLSATAAGPDWTQLSWTEPTKNSSVSFSHSGDTFYAHAWEVTGQYYCIGGVVRDGKASLTYSGAGATCKVLFTVTKASQANNVDGSFGIYQDNVLVKRISPFPPDVPAFGIGTYEIPFNIVAGNNSVIDIKPDYLNWVAAWNANCPAELEYSVKLMNTDLPPIQDQHDHPLKCNSDGLCEDCYGMPTWSVSEPYISLWLQDEPLKYQPALGPEVSFKGAFKHRDASTGYNTNLFGLGKKWNCSWLSYVAQNAASNAVVHFSDGMEETFLQTNSYLNNSRLTGDVTNGYAVLYPDGSKDVYGAIVTNSTGQFIWAFLTERQDAHAQKIRFYYSTYSPASPSIQLKWVVDADGRTNSIYYATNNAFSTNLISSVSDPFGRVALFAYDNSGHLTNITDTASISSSFSYDSNEIVTNMITPYGPTVFSILDNTNSGASPNGRTILVTESDGGQHLYLYKDSALGIADSYPGGDVPVTTPFSNTFDNSNINLRNTFHWGPRQYAALSTTNISSFTTNDFRKARMKHWLASISATVGDTVSIERGPSVDGGGAIEGQKKWYDYVGKTNNANEGTQIQPLFVAQVLPDGASRFTRYLRSDVGSVTNEISTYSVVAGGVVLLRTNIFVYDSSGVDLLQFTNANGVQVISNTYNAYHAVTTNYNSFNEKTVYTYDGSIRITSVTSPNGRVTTNIYGSDGFLARQIVVGVSTNSYTYASDLIATHTDARDLTTSNIWDNLQRLRRVDFPDGTYFTNSYNALDLVRVVDRMGFGSSFGYDAMRRKIAETNAMGRYTLYGYCNCGALDSMRDAAGNYTYFYYDNAGRQIATVYPDAYSVTNGFNLIGQLTNMVDSAGARITNWYNNQGLVVAVSNTFGRVQVMLYDALDRATNTVDANGVTVVTTYDTLDRVRTRSYPDGGGEGFGYTINVAGLTSYTNQLNQVTRFAYNLANRKVAETNANLEVTRFGYSGAGDILTLANGKNQVTTWSYDSFGRVTNEVDAANNVLFVYKYDPDNRLTNRWSLAKGSTVYRYDPVGNLTNIIYPVTPSISLAYDVLNRMTNMVDAVGTTKYNYDSVGHVLSEDGPWSDDAVSFSYTNRMRTGLSLLNPSASPWAQSYAYDAAKRITNVTSFAGSFGYSYNPGQPVSAGLLVGRLTLPNGAYITNTYDSEARLLSTVLKNSGNAILNSHSYQLNLSSQRTQQVFTAGNYVNYGYDNIGQLKAANGKESGGVTNRLHEQFGYTYDAAGNLNFRTNNALVQNFGVNNLNELTSLTRSGTLTVAGTTTGQATNVTVNSLVAELYGDFTFAKEGLTLIDGNNTFTAVARDSYGRVDTNSITVNLSATNVFAYDLNGNMLTNGTRFFEYDDENQLIRVTEPSAWKAEFTYDGKRRRKIEKNFTWSGSWMQTNEVRFVYDGNMVIQERDGSNVPLITLTRGRDLSGSLQGAAGIGGLLALTENPTGAHSFYHADGNGNVVALLNTNQLFVAKYEYDPFGNTLSISGPKALTNPFRFSSKPMHELSGMCDYLSRWYVPELQRWLNRDPIGEAGGLNLYAYVGNNPINRIDPLGLYIWETQYWADLSVNGSWWQKTAAWPLGVISAAVPDTGGISGGGTAGSGVVGSVGAANMSFWSKDPNDPCHGHNTTYTTVGVGVGSTQAGVNAGLALGWANFQSPTASSFLGDFTEANITIGKYSVTLWGGGGWTGITVGLAAGVPAVSGSVQNVNYQYAH